MNISKQLVKIASFLNDPLQRIQKYQFNIKLFDNKIFIISSFKKKNETQADINSILQYMIKQLQKHSTFIETKLDFFINKEQAPKKHQQFYMVFGAYDCKNCSDDQIKKIIFQWNNFGFKGGLENKSQIKTTQNSVY